MDFHSMVYGRVGNGSKISRFEPRRRVGRAFLLFLLFGSLLTGVTIRATGQESWSGNLRGTVLDAGSGSPVVMAEILIEQIQLTTRTDNHGRFLINAIPLNENPLAITVSINAPGYGEWRIEDVQLLAEDTLILNVELRQEPVLIQMPGARVEPPGALRQSDLPAALETMAADLTNLPIPETIIVRVYGPPYSSPTGGCDYYRTDPYETQVIDFEYYVKHVLPSEWIAAWPGESLRAGAMAVKMFGWFWVQYPGTWDVRDDVCDQVYNPAVEYESTNTAVDFTWNWRLTRNEEIFLPHYLDWGWRCDAYNWSDCIGQYDSYYHAVGNGGYEKLTWDEMLELYYAPIEITPVETPPLAGSMLRFYGNGWGDIDRVKIAIDPQVPADVDGIFTLEWWMRADPSENGASACTTGDHEAWTSGNILFDRDVFGDGDNGDYGVSLADGRIAFGVNNGSSSTTVCGGDPVADNNWHHVAVVRDSGGELTIFVDGRLDESAPGPTGDISYRDGRSTSYPNSDPFLVIGAEKHDANPPYTSFNGFLDEIRLSDITRYTAPFTPPNGPFSTDGDTVALFNFDEGRGDTLNDSSGASGGPSDGERNYGGDPNNGPEWFTSDLLFLSPRVYLPLIVR